MNVVARADDASGLGICLQGIEKSSCLEEHLGLFHCDNEYCGYLQAFRMWKCVGKLVSSPPTRCLEASTRHEADVLGKLEKGIEIHLPVLHGRIQSLPQNRHTNETVC